jgi:hypothetical protein
MPVPKVNRTLRRAARENFDKISDAQWFVCLFDDTMVEEVIPLLQMGLAIYLDKPILLLVPKGASVPMNLRRLALDVAEFDPTDPASLEAATRRLGQSMRH